MWVWWCGGGVGRYMYYYVLLWYIMNKKVTISLDQDVLSKFDEHIGIVKRSTAINELMKNEIKPGGGIIG